MKAFTPFIIIALCIGVYFMYIKVWISEIDLSRAKKAEYVNVLSTAQELAAKRDAISAEYTSISPDDLALFSKIVPNKFDVVVFANDISAIAINNNVTVKGIKTNLPLATDKVDTTGETESSPYKTIIITINILGKYEDFLGFLKDVESSLQLIDVVSLSMTQSNTNTAGQSQSSRRSTDTIPEFTLEAQAYSLE